MIEVYPVGSEVQLVTPGERTIIATVLQILISDDISYKVAYWSGSERIESWVRNFEVKPSRRTRTKRKIGFINTEESV